MNGKTLLLIFGLTIILSLLRISTTAQNIPVLPKSIFLSTNHEYEIGDTLVFKSISSSRSDILPIVSKDYYGEWRNNATSYKEGVFSFPPQKVRNKNYFVYHSDYPWGKVYKGTPVSDITNKKMVLIEKRRPDYFIIEYVFYNTFYNDTLLMRRRTHESKLEDIQDIAIVPRLDRMNTLQYIGQIYYREIEDTLNKQIGDRTIRTGLNHYHVYRPCTLVKIEHEFSFLSDKFYSKKIWLRDNAGDIFECDGLLYTKESLDEFEQESLDYLRSKRYHVVELEKVEKSKNQIVKGGELKENEFYEDNVISIKWEEKKQTFYFAVKNKTSDILKIIWDEALIINYDNYTERVLHKGTDIEALKQSQHPSLIPASAQLSDYFRPEREYSISEVVDGDHIKLVMPLQIGTNTIYYTFVFKISWKFLYPELQQN